MCEIERDSYTEIYSETESGIEKEIKIFLYTVNIRKLGKETLTREEVRCKEEREFFQTKLRRGISTHYSAGLQISNTARPTLSNSLENQSDLLPVNKVAPCSILTKL